MWWRKCRETSSVCRVQVNAAFLCDAEEDAISLPLSLNTDWRNAWQRRTSSEELCLSNILMRGSCFRVYANNVRPLARIHNCHKLSILLKICKTESGVWLLFQKAQTAWSVNFFTGACKTNYVLLFVCLFLRPNFIIGPLCSVVTLIQHNSATISSACDQMKTSQIW